MVESLLCSRIQKKQSLFQNPLSLGMKYQPQLQGGKCWKPKSFIHATSVAGVIQVAESSTLETGLNGFLHPARSGSHSRDGSDVISDGVCEECLPLPGASCTSFAAKGSLQPAQQFYSFIVSFSLYLSLVWFWLYHLPAFSCECLVFEDMHLFL